MSYPLPPDCLEWQEKIRAFVETELIPWEVEAEMNDGVIPEDARRRHQAMAYVTRRHQRVHLLALQAAPEGIGQGQDRERHPQRTRPVGNDDGRLAVAVPGHCGAVLV